MAKTPLDKFSAEIAGILEEYADDVRNNLDEITKEVGKVCRIKILGIGVTATQTVDGGAL